MELKRYELYSMNLHMVLLIVPYGIETGFCSSNRYAYIELLIVPYGIETNFGSFAIYQV